MRENITFEKEYFVTSFMTYPFLRRMRETIAAAGNGEVSKVIVAGLSNVYTHYITTYQVSDYTNNIGSFKSS